VRNRRRAGPADGLALVDGLRPTVLSNDSGDDNDDRQRLTTTVTGDRSLTVVEHRACATVGYGSEALTQVVKIVGVFPSLGCGTIAH
jgi:hypothetical protein